MSEGIDERLVTEARKQTAALMSLRAIAIGWTSVALLAALVWVFLALAA